MIVRAITPGEAAARLSGLHVADPRGMATDADTRAMCAAGVCFEVRDDSGAAVVVVHERGGVHWIDAAGGGGGRDLAGAIDQALIAAGARSIAFQTKRPGLVRRAQRQGYKVAGYIMRRYL